MTNDFTPLYLSSNLHYHLKEKLYDENDLPIFHPDRPDEPEETPRLTLFDEIKNRSFFLFRIDSYFKSIAARKAQPSPETLEASFSTSTEDCKDSKDFIQKNNLKDELIYDYIVFSSPAKCWEPSHKAEVHSGISDINLAYQGLAAKGVNMSVIYIPPGWAFSGENIIGKKGPQYRLSEKSVVSTQGLAAELKKELGVRGIPFLDLEYELNNYKKMHGNTPLYFPVDGHWNSYGHAAISEIIYDRFFAVK